MRICSGAGCLRTVSDGVRFCDECKPATAATGDIRSHTSGYDAILDSLRTGRRWQNLRKTVISKFPLCCRCERRVSEIVDHIIPAAVAIAQAQASGLYHDKHAGYYLRSNLQALCRPCHHEKTLEDKTHVGPWPDVVAADQAAPQRTYSF